MTTIEHGLSTPAEVEALADQISACADQLHARLEAAAAAAAGASLPAAAAARQRVMLETLLAAEQDLRQRANGLYADAAAAIVAGLDEPQREVIRLTAAAAEKIRSIARLGDTLGLVAGLLALAGGVASAQPGPVLAALETIRLQLAAVKAGAAP